MERLPGPVESRKTPDEIGIVQRPIHLHHQIHKGSARGFPGVLKHFRRFHRSFHENFPRSANPQFSCISLLKPYMHLEHRAEETHMVHVKKYDSNMYTRGDVPQVELSQKHKPVRQECKLPQMLRQRASGVTGGKP